MTDVTVTYCRGTSIGDHAACLVSKQINYDGTRGQDGSFTFGVQAQANGFGLEWGNLLTAGKRTDTSATNGTGFDTTASASFGWQAYLQVFAFTGTDVTVKIQDSADNATFADLSGAAFASVASGPRPSVRLHIAHEPRFVATCVPSPPRPAASPRSPSPLCSSRTPL